MHEALSDALRVARSPLLAARSRASSAIASVRCTRPAQRGTVPHPRAARSYAHPRPKDPLPPSLFRRRPPTMRPCSDRPRARTNRTPGSIEGSCASPRVRRAQYAPLLRAASPHELHSQVRVGRRSAFLISRPGAAQLPFEGGSSMAMSGAPGPTFSCVRASHSAAVRSPCLALQSRWLATLTRWCARLRERPSGPSVQGVPHCGRQVGVDRFAYELVSEL